MDTVTVTLPAHPGLVRVLRSVANRSGDLAGLGYDRVEDLGLAVDESANILLETNPGSIEATLSHADAHVEFTMSTPASTGPWPPANWDSSISGIVLGSVADSLHFDSMNDRSIIDVTIGSRRP